MTSTTGEQPYVLSYRKDDVEEDKRLNSQHEVIKHGILEGRLIHPSIATLNSGSAIADLGCGTGVWLDDIANTFFTSGQESKDSPAMLVGFDTNAHAFNPNPAPGVQFVDLPQFMLQQFLPPISGSEETTIINFNLLPGGISRDLRPRKTNLNGRFSDILLESIKLLLKASLIRNESLPDEKKSDMNKIERTKTQTLMDFVDETRKSDGIMMGGFFPQLVGRRSPSP
ncbi:MAG: hypothetical protein Q9195_004182 [Heterodermia aff. obscurata]